MLWLQPCSQSFTPLFIQFASCFASLQIVHNQRWVKAQNEASILPTIPVDIRISHMKGVQYRCTLYCSGPMGTHLNCVAIVWRSCHYWLLGMVTRDAYCCILTVTAANATDLHTHSPKPWHTKTHSNGQRRETMQLGINYSG